MASSCPTIILRRPISSDCASLPVLSGSSGMLSLSIFSTAFLLREAVCLGSLHHVSGNWTAIYLTLRTQFRFQRFALPFHPHFLGLAGRTSTALTKVLGGILKSIDTISATSSGQILHSDPVISLPPKPVATLP